MSIEKSAEDKQILLQCWKFLSDALSSEIIKAEEISSKLSAVKCIPNQEDKLEKPISLFFDDRPNVTQKFSDLLKSNIIRKPEQAWLAMSAARVRKISEVLSGQLAVLQNSREDHVLIDIMLGREALIKRILAASQTKSGEQISKDLTSLRFLQSDKIQIIWCINALGGSRYLPAEDEYAFLDVNASSLLYVSKDAGADYPWDEIARELALYLAPHLDVGSVSPGLSIVMRATNEKDAINRLNALGVTLTEVAPQATGYSEETVRSLDERIEVDVEESGFLPKVDFQKSISTAQPEGGPSPSVPPQSFSPPPRTAKFSDKLFDAQTRAPRPGPYASVDLPTGGPNTEASARAHTEQSHGFGRSGDFVQKLTNSYELRPAGKGLEAEFRNMVHGDYTMRCQVCGRTFLMRNGELQAYVVHLVEPRLDKMTNHYGDLVSLCGLHYAEMKFGQWAFVDPVDNQQVSDPTRLKDVLLQAPKKCDSNGIEYVGIRIRFFNVYNEWDAEPTYALDSELRYTIPHWTYLRALLEAD